LAVRDVPANFQGSTWLPAKNISLTEQWSDNTGHWGSGTPVTRTITIEAQGLRADQLPDLVFDKINGVSVYADRPKRTNNLRNDRVVGVYEQKVTYIPNSTQAFIIPALKINWWNTQTDSNAVAQLHEADVVVRPAPSAPNPPANIASAPMTHTPVTHDTNAVSKAFYTSVWFWIACLSLAAWAVTLWFMLRKKRDTDVKPAKQTPPTTEISDKSFEQACHSGQAVQAQQYLLAWAKTQWPRGSLNLASLRELIHDEEFNLALQELERALYSKKTLAWNGEALLAAFQRLKKSRKYLAAGSIKNSNLQIDPLPPLNPAH
jgi:phage terminase small subunit